MKGKNKLVPRLLGITKESVMRVDEKTKDVVQEWPLTTVKRWAASPKSFTLVHTHTRLLQHSRALHHIFNLSQHKHIPPQSPVFFSMLTSYFSRFNHSGGLGEECAQFQSIIYLKAF